MSRIKIQKFVSMATAGIVVGLFIILFSTTHSQAVAQVAITSPTNGQGVPGTNVTISGTSSPNASIVLSNNGISFAQTIADSSGNWSILVTSLPAGNATITAKAIVNTGFGYFPTANEDHTVWKVNQMRLSDNALNTTSGYPYTLDSPALGLMLSPVSTKSYLVYPFDENDVPRKFDTAAPALPVAADPYPAGGRPGFGVFSNDDTKFYSLNQQSNEVVIVDVATNAAIGEVSISGTEASTVGNRNNGELYIGSMDYDPDPKNIIDIISTETDSIRKTFDSPCGTTGAGLISFSQDAAYPYYFVPCIQAGKIYKMKLSDDSVIATWDVGGHPTGMAVSADNKKLFTFTSQFADVDESDTLRVYSTDNGSLLSSIALSGAAIGFLSSPDLKSIYVSTPGDIGTGGGIENIDVVNMLDNSKVSIATDGSPSLFTASSQESVSTADVNVSFVLGVATASTTPASQLAKTGIFVALASPVGLLLIGGALFTYYDYRRHKQPLLAVDSDASYSYFHHLKVVSLPLAKYRLSIGVDRQVGDRSDRVRRF